MTKCITDFFSFKGHYSNRISTQGQARLHDIKRFNIFSEKVETISQTVRWTKGNTRRGTPDIDAIINSQPVKIEVKIGKDSMRPDQLREQSKIEAAGGLFYVARNFPDFFDW
ncbi:MAG: hypothetical protein WKF97_19540 [Chitinophagaceae bacterium]